MDVVIGIDPHKASHTAVTLGDGEVELARLQLRSGPSQVGRLLRWAEPFPQRRWAIEGAEGLGFLLAQQLVAANQVVVDVPATLAARTRLLGSGRSNKNDPNDAWSVAVTAADIITFASCDRPLTPSCWGCWRSGISTCRTSAPASSLASTPWPWSSHQGESPSGSTRPTPGCSSPPRHRLIRSPGCART
jgi:hypothetical protein